MFKFFKHNNVQLHQPNKMPNKPYTFPTRGPKLGNIKKLVHKEAVLILERKRRVASLGWKIWQIFPKLLDHYNFEQI